MRIPDLSYWGSDEKFDSLIFFAQIMDEMLFDYTLDSYKAPIYNSFRLCHELIRTINDAKDREKDDIKIVNSIIKELIHQISRDPVALSLLDQKHNKDTRNIILKEINEAKSYSSLENLIIPLINLFEVSYLNEVKVQLKKAILNNDDPRNIAILSRILVSELLMVGYSKEYIYSRTNSYFFLKKFFSNPQDIENYISKYLDFFSGELKKWKIIIRGNSDFKYLKGIEETFVKILENKPTVQTSWIGEKDFFENEMKEYPYFIIFEEIEAIDQNQARKDAIYRLEFVNCLLSYSTYYLFLEWDTNVLIYSDSNYAILLDDKVPSLAKNTKFKKFTRSGDDIFLDLMEEHKNIYVNLNNLSAFSYNKSLNFYNAALQTDNPENQFLNLWIGLETLLTIPPRDTIGIHFKNSFTPFLCRNYISKLLSTLCNQLEFHLGTHKYGKIFNSITFGNSDLEKCALFISNKNENYKIWTKVVKEIGRNPLLKYRMDCLNEMIKSPNMIKKSIDEHQQRIEWHLERMYRTRNLITHKGEPIEIIDQLIENLQSYYHLIIDQIEEIAYKNDHIRSIESIIEIIKLEYISYISNLGDKSVKEINFENYRMFLFDNA